MKNFINIVKNKWLINTSKTVTLILILFALFIGINYGVNKLNLTSIDVTSQKLYSLTDESKSKIQCISKEVNIYFFGIDNSNTMVDLAKQYTKANKNIHSYVVNATEDSELYETYGVEEDDTGIVVASGDRSKVLSTYDFSTYDYSTGTSIDITEQKFTNTILDLTVDTKPQIYFLTGHSEVLSKMSTFNVFLTNEVNDVNNLDLLTSNFPSTCNCLILTTPKSDYSELEADKIIDYINNGGNILCLFDSFSSDFINVQKILNLYGATISDGMVRETDTSKTAVNDSRFIIPDISYHKITQYIITDGSLMFFESSKILLSDDDRLNELNVTPSIFIQSSDTSYLSTTEENGPFNLGVELTKTVSSDNSTQSKLILFSNSKFATDTSTINNQTISPINVYSNKSLLLNSVSYLTDKEDSIVIRKDTNSVTYTATSTQDTIIRLVIFIVPILIILFGIIIGQFRKRKN